MNDRPAILLFDGTCGFCARSVQFVLRHDRAHRTLRFASLQSEVGVQLMARRAELRGVDSILWLEPATDARPERVLIRSAAILQVLQYLGGIWARAATLGAFVPRPIRDSAYDFVARHRQQLAGAGPSCLVPTLEQRTRFIAETSAPPAAPDPDC